MSEPYFSIIIPSYNSLKLLKNALGSVLRQEYANYEVIITDDSTTDDICSYIKNVSDERIRYYRNTPSLGAVANWNHGLKLSNGNYIIVLHHDESFSNTDYLLKIKEQIEKGNDVVVSNVYVNLNGIKHRKKIIEFIEPFLIRHPSLLFFDNAIGPCACLTIKKEILQPFDERLNWYVDVEWYYRILPDAGKVIFLKDNNIYSISGHSGQITESINVSKVRYEDYKVLIGKYKDKPAIRLSLIINRIIFSNKTKKFLSKIIK